MREIVEAKALDAGIGQGARDQFEHLCLFRQALVRPYRQPGTQNAHGEYYLTDMAAILNSAGASVLAFEAEDPDEVLGANTIAEMMAIDEKLRMMTARRLMAEGVTIFRPETSIIDAGVSVGADTIIEPFVQLLGETKVGNECRIRS